MYSAAVIFSNEILSKGLEALLRQVINDINIRRYNNFKDFVTSPSNVNAIILQPKNVKEIELIKEKHPLAKVIILDERTNKERIKKLLSLKPDGYILSCCPEKEVNIALTNILTLNQSFFCDSVLTKVSNEGELEKLLTPTEVDILQLLYNGKTTKTIAEETCRSYHTINTHRKNMLKKLNCNNTTEMLKQAIDLDLI